MFIKKRSFKKQVSIHIYSQFKLTCSDQVRPYNHCQSSSKDYSLIVGRSTDRFLSSIMSTTQIPMSTPPPPKGHQTHDWWETYLQSNPRAAATSYDGMVVFLRSADDHAPNAPIVVDPDTASALQAHNGKKGVKK